jgi:EAL domain-containing protein (putative c-di-GMP-specific phosphodiesterase class I)
MDTTWFLESIAADGSLVRHTIRRLPFLIGRDPGSDLLVEARGLSRHHAQFSRDGDGLLLLTDLQSTNGTFVNRQRIAQPTRIGANDVLHFGNAEYRLGRIMAVAEPSLSTGARTMEVPRGVILSEKFVRNEAEFLEFLGGVGLTGAAQPIVEAATGDLFAYELLGRSTHPGLPKSPLDLFRLAKLLGKEVALSDAFRAHGVREIARKKPGTRVFVNTHPEETFTDGFLSGLAQLQQETGVGELIVEIHETAVVEVAKMRDLANRLEGMALRFAYDDFGAGEARINELAEIPAHFVKFDMGLIRDIHIASQRKQKVVSDLVRMVHDIGSIALAEGVESEADADVCRTVGFTLLQGYHTGRPIMLADL